MDISSEAFHRSVSEGRAGRTSAPMVVAEGIPGERHQCKNRAVFIGAPAQHLADGTGGEQRVKRESESKSSSRPPVVKAVDDFQD